MSASVLRGVIAATATAIDATGAPDHPSRRTANCNADLCARAWQKGDATALAQAVAIRGLLDGKPLVAGVKALLARYGPGPARSASAADRAAILAVRAHPRRQDGLKAPRFLN